MMNNKEPAFPIVYALGDFDRGMTLRDYFAAKALQVLLHDAGSADGSWDFEAMAAYEIADEMMRAREQS